MSRLMFPIRKVTTVIPVLLLSLMMTFPAQAMQTGTPDAADTTAVATPAVDVGPRFIIHPLDGADGDYFTLEADAGTTNQLVVVLGNADDEPLQLRTYANNVMPLVNGGFALDPEEGGATEPTTWMDYPAETFDFEPGQGVERTFTVIIPEGTEPGQYITGLALETAEPIEVEGTDLFSQMIRKTIAVFIIVPGPEEPAFQLGEPDVATDGALDQILVPVENTGNVLVRPSGEMIIRDADGEVVLTAPVAMGSVYAGTTVPLSVPLMTPLPEGEYTVSVDLTDEETSVTATLPDASISIAPGDELDAQLALTGDVSLAPDAENPVYADVALTITNEGAPIANAEALIDVMLDGEIVETFALAPPFSLPSGETSFTQRYVPPTGWEPGSWTFVVHLNVIDASTNATTNVTTLDTIPPLEVGE